MAAEPLGTLPDNTNAGQIAIDAAETSTQQEGFVPSTELIGGEKKADDKPGFSLEEFTSDVATSASEEPKTRARVPVDKKEKETDEKSLDKNDPANDTETEEKDSEAEEEEEDLENDPIKDKDVEKDEKLHGNTKRDYSGFSANQIKLLKRLDTPRFEKISTEWKALNEAAGKAVQLAQELEQQKELLVKGGIPERWYEHPEAFTLSKEFKDISAAYSRQEAVEQFYEQQLLNNKSGNEFYVIQGWDNQGNPIYSTAQKASNQGEIFLQRELSKATAQKAQLEGRSASLAQTYQQQHKQAANAVQSEVQGFIDKLDKDLKFEDKDVEVVLKALPTMYRDHPLAKCFAQVVALNFSQGRYINKTKMERTQQVKLDADKKLAGPRASKVAAQPTGAKLGSRKDTLSLDDFLEKD